MEHQDHRDKCFRFLINIDKCLNMSVFDMFFYKLQNEHCFSLHEVQSFSPESLRAATNDIRMYMKKYPYHVTDFRIIVTMRCEHRAKINSFADTLLFRIMQIKQALSMARIHIGADEVTEKALNLIMLYDTDTLFSPKDPENYLTSPRLSDDLSRLFRELDVDQCNSPEELQSKLQTICDSPDSSLDPAVRHILQEYLRADYIDSLSIEEDDPNDDEISEEPFFSKVLTSVVGFLRDEFQAYQVFEKVIDRNNQRLLTVSFLRLVKFINADVTNPALNVDNKDEIQTLSAKCRRAWDQTWALENAALEEEYMKALSSYKSRLEQAKRDLEYREKSGTPDGEKEKMPDYEIPPDDAVTCEQNQFHTDLKNNSDKKQDKHYRALAFKRLTPDKVLAEWEAIYASMKENLIRMETDLRDYSKALSDRYKEEIEARKRDAETWNGTKWKVSVKTGEQKEEEIDRDRVDRLKRLRDPRVGLAGKFQDELNMENALENANQTIRFSVECMRAVSFLSFLGLALVICGIGLLHGLLLQPYVLSSSGTAVLFLLYFAVLFILFFVCWKIPYFHYLQKVEACKETLRQQYELYGRGYQDQADFFRQYVNLLNQLDYINRYSRSLHNAVKISRRISAGYTWHRVQIIAHLGKLEFFNGLISMADHPEQTDDASISVDELCKDTVQDVADCRLYWLTE